MIDKVIGIDLSLTGTGIASSLGWVKTTGHDGITKLPLADRDAALNLLAADICAHVALDTDLVLIESPAYSRSTGGAHERAGLWWRVVHKLLARVPVAEISINHRCTYATGKGQAKKTEIVDAVARRWPAWQTGGDDNKADAVVLMAMGMDHIGSPIAAMPKTHRAALDKVTWPEVTR